MLICAPLRTQLLKVRPWTEDWRTIFLSDRTPDLHPGIAVVLINEETLARHGHERSPTPRDLLARVLNAVSKAKPKAIGLDLYFGSATPKDEELLQAVREVDVPFVLAAVNQHANWTEDQRKFQREFLAKAGRPIGNIGGNPDHEKDRVLRYGYTVVPGTEYPESFVLLLAKLGGPSDKQYPTSPIRLAWLVGHDNSPTPFLTIPAHELFYESEGRTTTKSQEWAHRLKDRIVLIAPDRWPDDRHSTPFSVWAGDRMLGVMIHATMLAQLLDGRMYTELTRVQTRFLLLGLGSVGFLLGWMFWRGRLDLTSRGLATAGLVCIDAVLYYQARIILPFTLALVAWLAGVTGGHHSRSVAMWALGRDHHYRKRSRRFRIRVRNREKSKPPGEPIAPLTETPGP
jgi:adenylate cyclase